MDEEMKRLYGCITAAWRFMRAHFPPDAAEEYRNRLIRDIKAEGKGKGDFMNELLVAVGGELWRMSKGEHRNNDT